MTRVQTRQAKNAKQKWNILSLLHRNNAAARILSKQKQIDPRK